MRARASRLRGEAADPRHPSEDLEDASLVEGSANGRALPAVIDIREDMSPRCTSISARAGGPCVAPMWRRGRPGRDRGDAGADEGRAVCSSPGWTETRVRERARRSSSSSIPSGCTSTPRLVAESTRPTHLSTFVLIHGGGDVGLVLASGGGRVAQARARRGCPRPAGR